MVASLVLSYGSACLIINCIRSQYVKRLIKNDTSAVMCIGKFWEASEQKADSLSNCQRTFSDTQFQTCSATSIVNLTSNMK